MKPIKLIYFISSALIMLSSCYQGDTADLIIHNARIYSCDSDFGIYQAMAIRDGKILQIGAEREILNGYKCDNIVDAELKPIYPGFYDAHCHFLNYAKTLREVNLVGAKSFDEVISRIDQFVKENPNNDWILGRGWDQTLWENDSIFPTNELLNKKYPNTPIFIKRIDGHAGLANLKALELAGFNEYTNIDGGQIIKSNGVLTGIIIDNAIDSLVKVIPDWTEEDKKQYLIKAQQKLFEQGLTSINDAGVIPADRDLFLQLYKDKTLLINDYMMLYTDDDNIEFASQNGIVKKNALHIRSFKIIADGALGSWGACLHKPYTDKSKQHGHLLHQINELKDIANLAKTIGYQVNTHAIGDSANTVMLKLYAEIIQDKPDHRWKIEHAQVLRPQDFDYFETIGIIPSIQPTHCTSDMRWAEKRLGKDRVKYAYAYNTLLQKAGLVALGTDFPIENISVLETFYAAISRKDKNGQPKNGFQKENALSRKDALMGITYWAAFSNFEEHERGSLETGKNADFVILSKDIMRIDETDILKTFVLSTYLNGKKVFSAN
ncbi:MAG TPA: amidohydrolase [Crocinitomix sp.]|nr:amidohydrolase [Crocinitomix sp.]